MWCIHSALFVVVVVGGGGAVAAAVATIVVIIVVVVVVVNAFFVGGGRGGFAILITVAEVFIQDQSQVHKTSNVTKHHNHECERVQPPRIQNVGVISVDG